MVYELNQVLEMLRIYHEFESEAKNFLFVVGIAMKNKDIELKSAQKTLNAIVKYKKLPLEVREEIERDKSTNASKIVELEKICLASINKK